MEQRRTDLRQVALKKRQQIVKAMWNAGLSRAEIVRETSLTYSQVTWDLEQQGLLTTKRHYRKGASALSDIMTQEDIHRFKDEHPPGTAVQDEDGNKYIVIAVYENVCEVEVSKHYKTCLRWQELARVDWNLKRGRNPKMEESNEDRKEDDEDY